MAKMKKDEAQKFKKLLVDELRKIAGDIQNMGEEALKSSEQDFSVDHMADHGSDNYDQDFTLSRMESDGEVVYEIRAALDRISDGSFGECESCKKPIPKSRLQAVPYARRCVPCQEKVEKGID